MGTEEVNMFGVTLRRFSECAVEQGRGAYVACAYGGIDGAYLMHAVLEGQPRE
jgi:hypothetical protein